MIKRMGKTLGYNQGAKETIGVMRTHVQADGLCSSNVTSIFSLLRSKSDVSLLSFLTSSPSLHHNNVWTVDGCLQPAPHGTQCNKACYVAYVAWHKGRRIRYQSVIIDEISCHTASIDLLPAIQPCFLLAPGGVCGIFLVLGQEAQRQSLGRSAVPCLTISAYETESAFGYVIETVLSGYGIS